MKKQRKWDNLATDTAERMAAASRFIGKGKRVEAKDTVALLEAVIRPGDRVNIEGNNQKQADFLADCMLKMDKGKVHDLHMVQSCVPLASHLDLFDIGIAKKLDFAFGGPQAGRVAKFIREGKIELGAIHTYLELFGRYFMDLTPKVSLICAYEADREGNLYTGFNTEDTPVIVEATKFRQGIVIAQVNKIVDQLPRIDIPAGWIDAVIESPKPFFIEPLFTRDPALITDNQILLAMLAMKGVYAEYNVSSMNHGSGFLTSAIELMLPTYGEELGLKGKCCTHMILNPHSGASRVPTAPSPRPPATTRWTCSSAAPCKSIPSATPPPPPPTASRASAAHRTWAAIRRAAVTSPTPG
jgi:malonate decarboxylase alpha subunit